MPKQAMGSIFFGYRIFMCFYILMEWVCIERNWRNNNTWLSRQPENPVRISADHEPQAQFIILLPGNWKRTGW